MGLSGTVLGWFESYLSNRHQRVKYKNSMSDPLCVQHGVPQGTALGPLLFLLYVNDIVGAVDRCCIELFADDAMIYITGSNLNLMQTNVNNDLENIFRCKNKLRVDPLKVKVKVLSVSEKK